MKIEALKIEIIMPRPNLHLNMSDHPRTTRHAANEQGVAETSIQRPDMHTGTTADSLTPSRRHDLTSTDPSGSRPHVAETRSDASRFLPLTDIPRPTAGKQVPNKLESQMTSHNAEDVRKDEKDKKDGGGDGDGPDASISRSKTPLHRQIPSSILP